MSRKEENPPKRRKRKGRDVVINHPCNWIKVCMLCYIFYTIVKAVFFCSAIRVSSAYWLFPLISIIITGFSVYVAHTILVVLKTE